MYDMRPAHLNDGSVNFLILLLLFVCLFVLSQKLESQMRDIAYGTKQYKAAPSEVNFIHFKHNSLSFDA